MRLPIIAAVVWVACSLTGPPSAFQDKGLGKPTTSTTKTKPEKQEGLYNELQAIKSRDVGNFGGNTFGPQFTFHPKASLAKQFSKFDPIKFEKRFEKLLIEKLNNPDDFFAAYKILNHLFAEKHQIDLLNNIVLKSSGLGWVAGIKVGENDTPVTIGGKAIRSILVDHWTKQFEIMEREKRAGN